MYTPDETINFDENWNNKLSCNIFTTIRRKMYGEAKYAKCQGMYKAIRVIDIRWSRLTLLPKQTIMTDIGMDIGDAYHTLFTRYGFKPDDLIFLHIIKNMNTD